MFEKIEIHNFQSHRHSVLDLHPGVNAIVGTSDSGKSAILRALLWAITNRPAGDSFRSSWGGPTRVKTVVDGVVVEREKSDKGNLYRLDDSRFEAMKGGVPEEIAAVFRMGEANIQRQLDAPFLLSNTPGEVARLLNEVANLDDIDRAMSFFGSFFRDLTSRSGMMQGRITTLQTKLDEFPNLEALDKAVTRLEGLEHSVQFYQGEIRTLQTIIKDLTAAEETLARVASVASLAPRITKLEEKEEVIVKLVGQTHRLSDLVTSLQNVKGEIECSTVGEAMEDLLEEMVQREQEARKLSAEKQSLRLAVDESHRSNLEVELATEELAKLEAQWHEEAPDVCPLCGQEFPS